VGFLSDRGKGMLLAFLASISWGTTTVCARYLTDTRGLDPFVLAACRFAFASVLLVGYVAATRRGPALVASMDDAPRFALLGLLGVVGLGVPVFLSAKFTYSVNANLITNANGILIAALAFLVGERVPPLRVAGLVVGLAGCGLVVAGNHGLALAGHRDLLGGAFALLSALSWALYTLLGKASVKRWGGLVATTASMCLGSVMMVAIALIRGGDFTLTGAGLWVLVYMAVVPTALAFVGWYAALDCVPANLIGPTQYIAPVLGIALGHFLLGEPVGLRFLAGVALVFAGLWLALRPGGQETTG
jgi:drug/metabolite transporter (DMT)-like permease